MPRKKESTLTEQEMTLTEELPTTNNAAPEAESVIEAKTPIVESAMNAENTSSEATEESEASSPEVPAVEPEASATEAATSEPVSYSHEAPASEPEVSAPEPPAVKSESATTTTARKTRTKKPAKAAPTSTKRTTPTSILTIDSDGEVETLESLEDTIWHDLQNAYRTKKILTGQLGGIEKLEGGNTIAIVYYKNFRVAIPLTEMMIHLAEDEAHDYGELNQRQNKIVGNMLGCEIDFIIKGLDNASRSLVASRKDAMMKKRQIFYLPDAGGTSRVYEDRIVQARIIAVAEKVIRVEIFGVETSILARDLSWDWLGNANEMFHVGEQILVRILSIKLEDTEHISVKADVKSVNGNSSKANLSKCKIQGKYAGTITDIHKGTVFVRLSIGVNAIAHSCYDNRTPGKKDEVSFVVTRIDEERNVAVGLISRIIRQNI